MHWLAFVAPKKAPIKGALVMSQTNQELVVKLEFERGFYKSTKFVLAAGLSFAVGVVNPEDRRSDFDVVSDLEVVVSLNGEVGVVTSVDVFSIGGVAGVRRHASGLSGKKNHGWRKLLSGLPHSSSLHLNASVATQPESLHCFET